MTSGSKSARTYFEARRELPLDDGGAEISAAAHDAAQGHVVCLTAHGQRLAAIAPCRVRLGAGGHDARSGTGTAGRRCWWCRRPAGSGRAGGDIPAGQAWAGLGPGALPGPHLGAGVPACRCVRSASSAGRQPGGSRLPSKGCAMTRARHGPGCSLVIHRPAAV